MIKLILTKENFECTVVVTGPAVKEVLQLEKDGVRVILGPEELLKQGRGPGEGITLLLKKEV